MSNDKDITMLEWGYRDVLFPGTLLEVFDDRLCACKFRSLEFNNASLASFRVVTKSDSFTDNRLLLSVNSKSFGSFVLTVVFRSNILRARALAFGVLQTLFLSD